MRRIEAAEDEEEAAAGGPGQQGGIGGSGGADPGPGAHLHLAIVNLVIGTLYCSKVGEETGPRVPNFQLLSAPGRSNYKSCRSPWLSRPFLPHACRPAVLPHALD
jgi:hypothetical protein